MNLCCLASLQRDFHDAASAGRAITLDKLFKRHRSLLGDGFQGQIQCRQKNDSGGKQGQAGIPGLCLLINPGKHRSAVAVYVLSLL